MLQDVPRLNLGHFPTPLREMPRLRDAIGCRPRLFIKHDDWSGPGFGGNKVRKLEYYFAQPCDAVITCGGEKSNHCRVTAALAARLGIECHLVLNPAADKHGVPASLWLDELYGAHLHPVRGREERGAGMAALAGELRGRGKRALEIPLGASTPLGALGFVRAAEELIAQTRALDLHPLWVVHATSSGGTQAGLVTGLRLLGLDGVDVLGVSADDPAAQIAATVRDIIAGVEEMLDVRGLQGEVHVDDRFVGPGYGIPTLESMEALKLLARLEGIVLDPVYTAKACAGMLKNVQNEPYSSAKTVVFWHTGGQLALFDAPFQPR